MSRSITEPLCLGTCGRTVRETVDDSGYCRKCLTARNPNDRRLTLKRQPDSEFNEIMTMREGERNVEISSQEVVEFKQAIGDIPIAKAKRRRKLAVIQV